MSSIELYISGGIVAITIICLYFKKINKNTPPWAQASAWQTLNDFGKDPVSFLIEQRKRKGDVFRVNLIFLSITFVIGPRVSGFTTLSAAVRTLLTISPEINVCPVESMAAEGDEGRGR